MRKCLFFVVSVLLLMSDQTAFSWDTTAAKYMPLQVGNTWVYYCTTQIFNGGTGYNRYKITGIFESAGKKYYQIERVYTHISGNISSVCGIPFFNNIRLDSNTMNVCQMGGCSSADRLLDSLLSHKNDTAWLCPSGSAYSRCVDTNGVNLFGSNFPSKKFNNSGGGNGVVYSKGLGITYWGFAELMTYCNDSLRGCVINGVLYGDTSTLVGVNQISSEIPEKYSLSQNYPNPFNPVTNIKFEIPEAGHIKLLVYDLLGKEIQTLVNEHLSPGIYNADFNASVLPSGVYYYKLEATGYTKTKKMALIK